MKVRRPRRRRSAIRSTSSKSCRKDWRELKRRNIVMQKTDYSWRGGAGDGLQILLGR